MRMKKKFLCVALSAMMLLPAVPIHAKQNTTINKTFITLPKKNSYTLKIKGTTFSNCSMVAVDFMSTDLSEVVFDRCDLYRAEFERAIASKADFSSSTNYTINPELTKIKKAIFSLEGAKGLLSHHQIIVE